MTAFPLSQINVARLNAPLDSPAVIDFRNGIDAMNALAESQPGFVWRGPGEGFDAEAHLALWWIEAWAFPTLADAFERLGHLRRHDPALHAFTFAERFAAPALETVS